MTSRLPPASIAGSRSPPRRTSSRCSRRLGTLQSAAAEAIIEEHDRDVEEGDGERRLEALGEMQASAADAPVIKLVYSILAQAVGEGASDIHLEPEER